MAGRSGIRSSERPLRETCGRRARCGARLELRVFPQPGLYTGRRRFDFIRRQVQSPKAIADTLGACRDNNLRELDLLIAAETEFSPDFCQFYLQECLHYQYGAQEKEGLSAFRKLCEKHSILWHDSRLII